MCKTDQLSVIFSSLDISCINNNISLSFSFSNLYAFGFQIHICSSFNFFSLQFCFRKDIVVSIFNYIRIKIQREPSIFIRVRTKIRVQIFSSQNHFISFVRLNLKCLTLHAFCCSLQQNQLTTTCFMDKSYRVRTGLEISHQRSSRCNFMRIQTIIPII